MRELSRLVSGFNIFLATLLVGAGLTVWDRGTNIASPLAFVVVGVVLLAWSELVFHVARVENASTGIAPIAIRVNLVLGCLIMVGLVVSIVSECVGNPAKVQDHDKNEATNLAAIKSELLDYEGLGNQGLRNIKIDESAKPDDVTSWALLRHRKYKTDGESRQYLWKLEFAVPDEDDTAWSQADLDAIDVVVIADSDYLSGDYRSTSGGEGTADSESVRLLYYNPKTGSFFGEAKIEGAPMGETVDTWHAEIDNTRVINKAEEDISYRNASESSPYGTIGMAFMVVVAVIHIAISVRRARERNRRGASGA